MDGVLGAQLRRSPWVPTTGMRLCLDGPLSGRSSEKWTHQRRKARLGSGRTGLLQSPVRAVSANADKGGLIGADAHFGFFDIVETERRSGNILQSSRAMKPAKQLGDDRGSRDKAREGNADRTGR